MLLFCQSNTPHPQFQNNVFTQCVCHLLLHRWRTQQAHPRTFLWRAQWPAGASCPAGRISSEKNRGMSPAGLGSLSWVLQPPCLIPLQNRRLDSGFTIDKWWPTFTSLTFVFNCILSWPIIRVEPHLHGRFFCQTTCGHWKCGTVFLLEHLHDLQDVSEISSRQQHASFVSQR